MSITIVHCSWGALAIVWVAAAGFTKPTLRGTDAKARVVSLGTILLGFCLLGTDWPTGWLAARPLLLAPAAGLAGVALTIVGCSFAIWARLTLGSNWSGRPTLKTDHELVVSGPYALTRHPIYTGILLAALGTALADLHWRSVLGILLITPALLLKVSQEERLMLEAFPESYPSYRRRVKALIPGLL